jgi:hypothetical protein
VPPVLQCPDCQTKHSLADVPEQGTFPCTGCGRALKVPEFVPRAAQSSAPAAAPAAPPVTSQPASAAPPPADATQIAPAVVVERNAPRPQPEPAAAVPATGPAPVPWWMRGLLWVVAVPISFFVVFMIARVTGIFTHDELSDVFLADGADRFWPIARLLPIVALLMAGLVQLGVVLLSRRRQGSRGR